YTVASVTNKDLTGGSPAETWSYDYKLDGSSEIALWHHDYNEAVKLAYRSWSLWMGYPTVTVRHGPAGGQQTVTKSVYYRGMDGDARATPATPTGVTWDARRVWVT